MRGVKHPWLVKRKKNTSTLLSCAAWRVKVEKRRWTEPELSEVRGQPANQQEVIEIRKHVGSRRLYSGGWMRRRWRWSRRWWWVLIRRPAVPLFCSTSCLCCAPLVQPNTIWWLSNWESQCVRRWNNPTSSSRASSAVVSRGLLAVLDSRWGRRISVVTWEECATPPAGPCPPPAPWTPAVSTGGGASVSDLHCKIVFMALYAPATADSGDDDDDDGWTDV